MKPRHRQFASALAALGYLVEGIAVIGHHVPDSGWTARGYVVDAAAAIAFLASAVALTGLAQCFNVGRIGTLGTRIAQVGFGAMALESFVALAYGGTTLGPVFFLGLLSALIGLLALAISGVRAGTLRWAAPLLFVGLFVSAAAGENGGSIALALIWPVLAWLVTDRPEIGARPVTWNAAV